MSWWNYFIFSSFLTQINVRPSRVRNVCACVKTRLLRLHARGRTLTKNSSNLCNQLIHLKVEERSEIAKRICIPYFLYKEHQTSVEMLKYLWWYFKQSSKHRGINLMWGHNVSTMGRNGETKQVNYLFITIECVVLEFGKAKPIIRYSNGPTSLMRFSWYQNLYIQTKWVRDLFTTNSVFQIFDIFP